MPKFFQQAREPMSSYTHFIGAVLAAAATAVLSVKLMLVHASILMTLSCIVFGFSMMLLYSASSIYHYAKSSAAVLLRLRKLDHAMIYVLIAGTYTPILLNFLDGIRGIVFTCVVWGFAFAGIAVKLLWFDAPRLLSTILYVLLGWSIMLDLSALTRIPAGGIWMLVLGGLSYSAGALIYGLKKPNLWKKFGFHELFHIFVIVGTTFHFLMVLLYIV